MDNILVQSRIERMTAMASGDTATVIFEKTQHNLEYMDAICEDFQELLAGATSIEDLQRWLAYQRQRITMWERVFHVKNSDPEEAKLLEIRTRVTSFQVAIEECRERRKTGHIGIDITDSMRKCAFHIFMNWPDWKTYGGNNGWCGYFYTLERYVRYAYRKMADFRKKVNARVANSIR